MHRFSTPFRLSISGLALLTVVMATGCTSPEPDPRPSADTSGWAILSSSAAEETLRLDVEGGAETTADALALDGVTGYGSAESPEDFDATSSFTVAAWAATTDAAGPFATVLSQIGVTAAGFFLGLAEGMPAFSMKDADSNEPGHTIRAVATDALDADEWVHMAGVFNADEGEISLFIDGELVATTPFDAPWQPLGALTVGRSQAHGAPADFWAGAISEVRIAPVTSSAADIEGMMDQSRPSEPPPHTAAADPSTYADGALNGTWDSALSAEEIAFVESTLTPAESTELNDLTALRLGFSGPRWWEGFVEGDEVWLVNGVPEGDGGIFSTLGNTLTMTGPGGGFSTVDWSLVDDRLTFVLTDCRLPDGAVCEDIEIVRMMVAREWTFRSSDPSFD